jgi:glycerol-3-phosphate acyltransferase PlsY
MNLFLTALFAYLLGAIPSGVIVSRAFGARDVRAIGSGHTGALNTFRATGFFPAAFTFLADAGKAVIAIEIGRGLTQSEWGVALAGVMAVVGHCLPIYTRGRGGMGLTVGGAVLFFLVPLALIILLVFWFPIKFFLKQSARASAVSALLLPVILWLMQARAPLIAFGIGAGAVIFLRHLGDWNRQNAS